MSSGPVPVIVVVNDILEVLDSRSATDFGLYYDNHTVYDDLQYVRTKVGQAVEMKERKNYKGNDFRVDSDEVLYRKDLFAGEIESALDRLGGLLEKIEETDDFYNLTPMLRRHRDILNNHLEEARNGNLYYNNR